MEIIEMIVCRGIPASGKTTYSKKWVSDDIHNRVRVNKDDIRNMLFDGKYTPELEKQVKESQTLIIKNSIKNNKHVIIDNTHLKDKDINELIDLAKECKDEFGKTVVIKIAEFPISIEDALERNSKRNNPVPNQVIIDMYNKCLENNPELCIFK